MRVAVVTPFHSEKPEWLQQAQLSVRWQTWPCTHILVGDASPALDPSGALVIRLPRNVGDYGDTPRAIGGMYAAGLGFDAVAYLDGDNWFYPDHIENLVRLHQATGAPVVTSRRAFHRLDGTYMAECLSSDGESFSDTNCLLLTREAFSVLGEWALMPSACHAIDDRVIWSIILDRGFARAHHPFPTIAYRVGHIGIYRDLKESPPQGAKMGHGIKTALQAWAAAGNRTLSVRWRYRRYRKADQLMSVFYWGPGGLSSARIENVLKALEMRGHVCSVLWGGAESKERFTPATAWIDAVVTSMSPNGWKRVHELMDSGWSIVADVPFLPNDERVKSELMQQLARVDALTTTSEDLQTHLRVVNQKCDVISESVLDTVDPSTIATRGGPIRILVGPSQHPDDLEVIHRVMSRLSEEVPNLEFVASADGPKNIPPWSRLARSCAITDQPFDIALLSGRTADLEGGSPLRLALVCCASAIVPLGLPGTYSTDPASQEMLIRAESEGQFYRKLHELCVDAPALLAAKRSFASAVRSSRQRRSLLQARPKFIG